MNTALDPRPWRRRDLTGALLAVCATSLARTVRAADAPPLRISSSEVDGELRCLVQAHSPFAFDAVRSALDAPPAWCDVLMLHMNNKACRVEREAAGPSIALSIARKHEQTLRQAHQLQLQWRRQEASPQRLVVQLEAPEGPFGTTDYQVQLTAEPAAGAGTQIGLRYACRFGSGTRLAMQAYLATVGRDKVGFSSDGGQLVGGLRGVAERTAVRYYLAIDAWLQAATLPPAQQAMARLQTWFRATERYPRQLHEMDEATYLANKRRELGLP